MPVKRVQKEALVAATIIFDQSDVDIEQIHPNFPNCYVDVIGLTALDGNPVIPGAGTFTVTVKTDIDGGFKTVGVIAAAEAGGSAGADGAAVGLTFTEMPQAIKIVPAAVTTAVAYRVLIKQKSAQ